MFDPRSLHRISRTVRAQEAAERSSLYDPRLRPVPQRARGVPFQNDTTETIPAYGVMAVKEFWYDDLGNLLITCRKPSVTDWECREFVVNGSQDVEQGGIGLCFVPWTEDPVEVLYDGLLYAGDIFGPVDGQWYGSRGGFSALGTVLGGGYNADTRLCSVVAVPHPFTVSSDFVDDAGNKQISPFVSGNTIWLGPTAKAHFNTVPRIAINAGIVLDTTAPIFCRLLWSGTWSVAVDIFVAGRITSPQQSMVEIQRRSQLMPTVRGNASTTRADSSLYMLSDIAILDSGDLSQYITTSPSGTVAYWRESIQMSSVFYALPNTDLKLSLSCSLSPSAVLDEVTAVARVTLQWMGRSIHAYTVI